MRQRHIKPFRQQTLPDAENGVHGDSFRTCLASLLGVSRIEDVPDYLGAGNKVWDQYDEFLAGYDLQLLTLGLPAENIETTLQSFSILNPSQTLMLTGKNQGGDDHTVLIRGGHVIHCPISGDVPLGGPSSNGLYWLTALAWRI